jgi:broad specificity phosphatase PhoE
MTNINIPEREFILIRHAETEANLKKIACGLMDSPLSLRGISQAESLGKSLQKAISGKVSIVHSALRRSIDTAHIIAQFLDVENTILKPDMNEHSFGDWEGRPWRDVLNCLNEGLDPPGGESRAMYRTRVVDCLRNILSESQDNKIPLIVAHGGTFYVLASLHGFYPKEIENCGAIHFIPTGDPNICKWKTRRISHQDGTWIDDTIFFQGGSCA